MDLSEPQVMGILNATPDSFYAASRQQTEREVAERANRIVAEGGTMIDVGAYSTRPGAAEVTEEEETARLRVALGIVRREQPDAVLSVDTFRPQVARMAVEEFGADIINDVSGGNARGAFGGTTATETEALPEMFRMVSRLRVSYILMSTQPDVRQMLLTFARSVQQLRDLGQKDIILDPGFGFGKSLEQNYAVMARLEQLQVMGLPVLTGVSRKSMVYGLMGTTADEALNGTTALHMVALMKGASILRVHDVKEAVECCKVWRKIERMK